ncbi:hypothetical protein ALC57_14696 [Trachymyrmex cornetzi]|uniref:Uncharacterized protein n=1 Tax=Trachymyrmex cornetzi TaxID=471704 RepID=A0A151IXV9_9HYME|nr:hypothetical protein ALC57_14696 [Trachymyrmex cornetzi]
MKFSTFKRIHLRGVTQNLKVIKVKGQEEESPVYNVTLALQKVYNVAFALIKKKTRKVTLTFVVADVAKHHIRRQQRNACILPRGRIRTEIFCDVGRHCYGLQERAEEAEVEVDEEQKENEKTGVE